MAADTSPNAPIIIVFGITGDLSRRKLLPALYHLLRQDLLPAGTKIIGLSRRPLTNDQLLETVELCVLEKDKVCDPDGLKRVQEALSTIQLDPTDPSDYESLVGLLVNIDPHQERQRLFYMSVPADAYTTIIKNLGVARLNGRMSRILVEKPFGHDYESAQHLLALTSQTFEEKQIYRIDHYLAKETAQNLLAFRMHNPIFTPLWDAEHIRRVHIRALEKIGIEGRGSFYEQTGALRDLVQSHLMQLLAITLMDVPADMSSQAIHKNKQYFLSQLVPADPVHALRGQYKGYLEEAGNTDSFVETYASVKFTHAAEHWKGTEIILETGKGMAEKTTDITIQFKQPHEPRHNDLTFRIQPNEGITLGLMVKEPGFANHMRNTELGFRYREAFEEDRIDAYERVLIDAVNGDQALFASDEEVLATWQALQPLVDAWGANGEGLKLYPQGAKTLL